MIPRTAGQASDSASGSRVAQRARDEFDPSTSWRPAPAWQVVAWRGFGEARQRLKRAASTLAEGRQCADDLVAAGWESAEVSEKLEAPRRPAVPGHSAPGIRQKTGSRRGRGRRRKLGTEGALSLDLAPSSPADGVST